MLFNSFEFIALVIATAFIYYLPIFSSWQVPVLITSSLIFYGSSQPALTVLLLASIFINAVTSYNIRKRDVDYKNKVVYAACGVAANLLILGFFKYSTLISSTFLNTESDLGEFLLLVPLPIGISFYTFQGISLLVDTLKDQRNSNSTILPELPPLKYALNITFYISFFPQLVAGPIVKAHDFIPQIRRKFIGDIDFEYCFRALVTGYFLKMAVADNLRECTTALVFPEFQHISSYELVAMLYGYSIQIFADFAGYSLIAIGVAGLFGYRLPKNFNFPYISKSITEFWRRWHISLSSFLKEYLYIPLGGNRKGKFRTYLNLMIVMLLGGLWHGAAWNFMVWGGFHGLMLAVERYFSQYIKLPDSFFVNAIRIMVVFILVSMAWLLFKLTGFSHVIAYIESVSVNGSIKPDYVNIISILVYSAPVVVYHVLYLLRDTQVYWLITEKLKMPVAAYGTMMFLVATNSGPQAAFVYFQF